MQDTAEYEAMIREELVARLDENVFPQLFRQVDADATFIEPPVFSDFELSFVPAGEELSQYENEFDTKRCKLNKYAAEVTAHQYKSGDKEPFELLARMVNHNALRELRANLPYVLSEHRKNPVETIEQSFSTLDEKLDIDSRDADHIIVPAELEDELNGACDADMTVLPATSGMLGSRTLCIANTEKLGYQALSTNNRDENGIKVRSYIDGADSTDAMTVFQMFVRTGFQVMNSGVGGFVNLY